MLDKETKDLLPILIQNTMSAITELTNAPDEMTLPVTLAIANFGVQGLANADPVAWNDPCSISNYFAVLVPSGGMKTGITDSITKSIKRFEKEQEVEAEEAKIDYEIQMKQYKRAIDDEVKDPQNNRPNKPVKPKGSRYKLEKATTNGLINTLESVPFAGLFSTDAGEFFNSYTFQDPTKSMEMVAVLSKAWSGEAITRVTGIEDNNLKLHNRRFNMLVLLQQELAGFLTNPQFKDQGFTNRILITQCELFQKPFKEFTPEYKKEQKILNSKLDAFNDRIYDLLTDVEVKQRAIRSNPVLEGTMLERMKKKAEAENADPKELILLTHEFNDDALPTMQDFYNEMAVTALNPINSEYANFYNRAYEHCVRLAVTLSLFDLQKSVSKEHAQCAVGLMRYFFNQRNNLNIDGAIKINPIVECGEMVIKWLKKRTDGEATKAELIKLGPNVYRKMDTDQRLKVICDLEARELIEIKERIGTGNKNIHIIKLLHMQ